MLNYKRLWFGCIAVILFAGASASADTNFQVSLSPDGLLSWTNSDPSLYYSVEWRPSLDPTNAWNSSYRGLQDIRSSNSIITVPVPMFLRLSGSTGQAHTLTLNPGNTALLEGYYAATNLSSVDPDLSAENIQHGITIFGVNGTLVPANGTATPADVTAGKTFYGFGQSNWNLQLGTAGTFTCASNFFDLNGLAHDECEFQLDPKGIYVSVNDPAAADSPTSGLGPVGTGSGHHPCASITFGIQRAVVLGRTNVYVANGVYTESLTLANGVNLKGGYNPADWSRNVTNSLTMVRPNAAGLHKKVVSGTVLSQPIIVEGFVFFGQPADQSGGNSYVIWLRQNSGLVTLRHNMIFAANGANGARGSDGVNGADGAPGSTGSNAIVLPSPCSPRSGSPAGINTCSSVNGGAGGGNNCSPVFNTRGSGLAGATATGTGGGVGGLAGYDSRLDAGGICVLPAAGGADGAAGGSGSNGANGTGGPGATSGVGFITGNEWIGASGSIGTAGQPGRGGGGGGAGGGAQNNGGGATLGGTGGGGGAGGCGGGAGNGGGAGGGSIGVFISGGVAPSISQCHIYLGRGGDGGAGGAGGLPGKGGTGGAGGSAAAFCSGQGGTGGNGGVAGAGGGGGGGSGGVSYGILVNGATSVPNYGLANNLVSGAAGQGGAGGQSFGSSGSSGVAGSTQTINIR